MSESLVCRFTDSMEPQSAANLCWDNANCSLIPRTFLTTFSLLLAQFLEIVSVEQLSLTSFAPTRISKFTQASNFVKLVKSLRRKLEFKTLSAHKIQIDSFDYGERLTRETDFVGVRSSPCGFIVDLRPSSHLRTVYFTERPAWGGAGISALL